MPRVMDANGFIDTGFFKDPFESQPEAVRINRHAAFTGEKIIICASVVGIDSRCLAISSGRTYTGVRLPRKICTDTETST